MVLFYQLLPPLPTACRAVWEVLRDVGGWLWGVRRTRAAPGTPWGRNDQILEAQPMGLWSLGRTTYPLKTREILVKCRAEHFLYAVLSAGFLSTSACGDPGSGGHRGQVDAGGASIYSLGDIRTQKPVPSRVTGTVLQKSAEDPLACESNTLWTTEQL